MVSRAMLARGPRAKGRGQACDQTHGFVTDGEGPFACSSTERSWNTKVGLRRTDLICYVDTNDCVTK